MTDPYRVIINPEGGHEPRPGASVGVLRPLLWLALVVSTVGNTVVSLGNVGTGIHLGFGVVTALCVIALIVHHLRSSR